MSPISEAKKRANKKWNDANMKERYDRVQLVLAKGRKAELQAFAERHGQSVNGFVSGLIDEALVCAEAEGQSGGSAPAVSPTADDGMGAGYGFSAGSSEDMLYSRIMSQWGDDFQTALSNTGQSPLEFIEQAVGERIERERKPPIPQWIAERYPGEKYPVLQTVRAIQGDMNAQRRLRASMTQDQQVEWDNEFRRELDEERRQRVGQEATTCNLPLD